MRSWAAVVVALTAAALVTGGPATVAAGAGAPDAETRVLVTFASEASLRRSAGPGGALDRAHARSEVIDRRIAVAEVERSRVAALRSAPGVLAVEADAAVFAAEAPDDPCYTSPLTCAPPLGSWQVDAVGLPAAWDLSHGTGVTVAVIDSGIQSSPVIPELAGRVLPEIDGTGGTPPCGSSGDGNHGTQVATVAGANTGNGLDGPGAGWAVQILPVRIWAGPSCTGTTVSRIVEALGIARRAGAQVINLSSTTTSDSTALRTAVEDAVAAGVVVVAAAGNSASTDPRVGKGGYPAFYDDVIAVGASTIDDTRSSVSNHGSWVDLYAPGEDIPANRRDGSLAVVDGTSFAAPLVAGVVALMRATNPGLTPAEVRATLVSTADATAAGPRLDAAEAVAVAACATAEVGATAAAVSAGVLDVLTASADGRPCERRSPGSETTWSRSDGRLIGSPDLLQIGGAEFAVGLGVDQVAYLRSRSVGSSWGPWVSLGGRFSADLSVVSWGPGRLDVFGRGLDGALWHSWTAGGAFSPWTSLGGGLASEPDVSSWSANRLDVFAVGLDGAMWHRAWNGATWLPWEGLGGGFTAGPGTTATAPGRVDVVASGRDEQLWLRSWLGSGWTPWTPLGGRVVAGAELVATGSGNLLALVRGADQRLYQRARVGGSWQAWTRLP